MIQARGGESARCSKARSETMSVTHPYSTAIVLDLQQLETTFLEGDFDEVCACVQTILDELFEGICWSVYDLACCDAIDHGLV